MTIFEWRKISPLPTHEAEILIQHVCNLSRTDLILNEHNYELTAKQELELSVFSKRRINNSEPLQYLLGYTYFYGEKFYVTPDVLIPRFDTETLIDSVIPVIKEKKASVMYKDANKIKILDLCTGSGCIICTLAREFIKSSNILYVASDISEKALTVAKKNAANLPVNFVQSDLFGNIEGSFDIIVSNPPYISKQEMIELDKEVADFEPHLALYGGLDGLDIYRRIAIEIPNHIKSDTHVFLEIGFAQGLQVAAIFKDIFSKYEIIKDIDNKDRVVHLFNF